MTLTVKITFIIFLIFITILFIYTQVNESFVSYKRCDSKPLKGITKEIFDTNNITKSRDDDWEIYIPCGYNGIERELKELDELNEKQSIYGIDGCDKIVAKNGLWKIILTEYGFKKASEIMPTTYLLDDPKHMEEFESQFNKDNIYILKRNVQRKKGIKISNDLYEITNSKYDNFKLVQDMKESYLINDRKFNIRLYMLIVSNGNSTKVYLHKLNKLLYASQKVNLSNKLDFNSNITNSYIASKDIYNSHPFNIKELEKITNDNNITNHVKEKMFLLSRAIVLPLNKLDKLKKTLKFQLFGVDAIYDKNGDIFILEINKGPDMNPKDERDKKMKKKVISDTFQKIEMINDNANEFNLYEEIYSY